MKPDVRKFRHRRADLMAFLRLTDRPDMVVDRLASRVPGNHFTATLLENHRRPTEKSFRVVFKGIGGIVDQPHDLQTRLKREIEQTKLPSEPIPVCLFVFTMGDDRGYYAWLKQPLAGAPVRTVPPAELSWSVLDENGMADIVSAVNAWYSAQRQAQAA